MRISDWSSDVCSSDLLPLYPFQCHGGDNLILKKSGLAIGNLMFERYSKVSSHRIRGRYAPPMAENGGLYPLQVACVIHMPPKVDVGGLDTPAEIMGHRSDARSIGNECEGQCGYR